MSGLELSAWRRLAAPTACALALGLGACTPTVQVVAPDKPIEINLNVTISQEIRIMMEPEIEELIEDNPDLF